MPASREIEICIYLYQLPVREESCTDWYWFPVREGFVHTVFVPAYGEREIFAVHILYLYQLTGGEGSEHICTSFRGEREILLYILVPAYGEREIHTYLFQLLMR